MSIQAKHTPTLEIGRVKTASNTQQDTTLSLDELSKSISDALTQYPYYIVVNGFTPLRERNQLMDLARAIRAKISPPSRTNHEDFNKVSFTKVYINRQNGETEESSVTRYSRTHLRLPPHTDSSYMMLPHEIVAFHCIEADENGGESIMVPIDDILQNLDKEVVACLREPVYPFGQDCHAIICGDEDNALIRYYQAQIQRSLNENHLLSEKHQAALKALDELLDQNHLMQTFHLKPGQIVFMQNHKVLHGRTALSPESNRVLYRLRMHVNSLGNQGKIAAPQDVNSYMELATELENMGRFESALEQYRYATEFAADDMGVLNAYGSLLLKIGQFDRATEIFNQCKIIDPNDYESGLALSSLARMKGNQLEAKALLKPVMKAHPLVSENENDLLPEQPTILRIRGIEDAAYSILRSSDGTSKKLLRGGHFAISDLLDDEDYNMVLLNVFENNVDTLNEFPKFDLMLNTIACPDSKQASLLAAARFVDRYPHIPIVNHPRQVLETSRIRNSLRLNTISGVKFPKTEKVWWSGDNLDEIIKTIFGWGFEFPFIVRKVGSQTGQSVALLDNEPALREHLHNSPTHQEYYIIQFQDCRIRHNVYHKMRVFFIDGTLYPVANVFNDTWDIHSGDRYSVMDKSQWMQAEERAFLGDTCGYLGCETFNRLYRIYDIIKLDFFGIDLTILPDGTIFIFELNAAMRHNFDHAKNFPYTRPYLERISNAFAQMVRDRFRS
ncbi:Taurine catabolism dioxygenase TauD, TfdA family [Rivularia sp. PCC 7116]|uniref:TauD/TfdA family dioxygenase n=1 Tax=Rivularia sp. PCC 7116 TaxID=373994 RepID=UPI00029F3B9F|nr:TauD/TfdA family dioxygenase [Rivularia sp. PCC 7116]AFY57521.1 Taurine catabolism dioxygenase TauD, TfdA family [Rivularia sp. PCC 7116]